MADTVRQTIMRHIVTTLAASSDLRGVVDCRPWDYEQPPRPEAGDGEPALPFVWAYEDQVAVEEWATEMVMDRLPVTVETVFRYSRELIGMSLEREGRRLLGVVQGLLAADVTRGGQALDTAEQRNVIAETPTPDLGVVVSEWLVTYPRDRTDPTRVVSANA